MTDRTSLIDRITPEVLRRAPPRLRAALLALLGIGVVGGGVIIVDPGGQRPPPRPPPVIEPPPPGEGWEGLPFEVPEIPAYSIPTEADCDWIVDNGSFSSKKGLGSAPNVNAAYRASIAAGHATPIKFGVRGGMGSVVGAGLYNGDAPQSVTARDGSGNWRNDISFEIVGLNDQATVTIGWTDDFGRVAHIGLFNVGLVGPQDSFYVRANDGIDTLLLDGCWYAGGPANGYTSGIHMDKWQTLVIRHWKFKGALLAEHLFYLKSCIGTGPGRGTWIVDNDLRGGNRTGFQIRPDKGINPEPTGPVVIAGNVADGYGWTHGSDGSTKGGGSCLTVWSNPTNDTFIFRNRILNARYGCLVLSGQGASSNYLNADGFPIKGVYVYDNEFSNPNGDRTCITVSACQWVHLYGRDTLDGPGAGDAVFDDTFNMGWNGILNGTVEIYDAAYADYLESLNVRTYDPANPGKNKDLPDTVIDGWVVTEHPR